MSITTDLSNSLQERVCDAYGRRTQLRIVGSDSKAFYGNQLVGARLTIAGHSGVVAYEPTELVLTARAGTRLAEIEQILAAQGQMLAFEPPYFGTDATLGGMLACGFSGPRRPYAGAVRDFVLGCKILSGKGEILSFGGQVIKNVAGYDVSRLMTGAMGTLGILLEISIKVLPQPENECSIAKTCKVAQAIDAMCHWAASPLPVSAACYDGRQLFIRVSGPYKAVVAATNRIGGDNLAPNTRFWQELKEHKLAFFNGPLPLWRLSVAPGHPAFELPGPCFYDWGGAQRWLRSAAPSAAIRAVTTRCGGHATLFRTANGSPTKTALPPHHDIFDPLPTALRRIHKRLKDVFDPRQLLNYGRYCQGLD